MVSFISGLHLFTSLTLCAYAANAQTIIDNLSFGPGKGLAPGSHAIPGWSLAGENHAPQLYSDKVILTPPYPGHSRGFLWSENQANVEQFSATFGFRATGPERGGGNIQLWYVKDGRSSVGSSSIYTVGKFDGFALVVDTHGGRGNVRGFLNDGSTDYSKHTSVDSLPFGNCDYSYRNLGRPSEIEIKQTANNFAVYVDKKLCFQSPLVSLPTGNTFGITAASAENPDSFEVFNFSVENLMSSNSVRSPPVPQNDQQGQKQEANAGTQDQKTEDRPAEYYKSHEAQFADLHNRLQLTNKGINNAIREIGRIGERAEQRHRELLAASLTQDHFTSLDARLDKIEQSLKAIQRDLQGKDYQGQFNRLHESLQHSHNSLSENLQSAFHGMITAATPRMGFFLVSIVAVQLLLATSYIIYKRRRSNMPKKYL